jgi:glycosyltransferase involved in cell wall biosynthesis
MQNFIQNSESFSLTVIVPNMNDSKYLSKCIESVVNQDTPPDEFIILDDASTDNSVNVISEAIKGYPFARLVCNVKNLGGGGVGNANMGLSLAKGKFIFFLGANDFLLPGIFRRIKKSLDQHPNAGLWSAMVWLVDENGDYIRMHPSSVLSQSDKFFSAETCRHIMMSNGNWLTGQTTVYRREALIEAGGFDASLMALNDLLAAHVVASRYGAAFSPEPLGVMRVHKGAFLVSTLSDSHQLNSILDEIEIRGPKVEPRLFTTKMLARTRLRFYFASLRISKGETIQYIMSRSVLWRRFALTLVSFIPKSFSTCRTVFYFLIMRPFDVLPTIWYRLIGSGIVLIKEHIRGRVP